MLVAIVIVIAIALAIALVLLGRHKSVPREGARSRDTMRDASRVHFESTDFHMEGDRAVVGFDVDVPPAGVDAGLRDLLERQAIEVLRERRMRGLPVDGATSISIFGTRGVSPVEVITIDVQDMGALLRGTDDEEITGFDDVDPLGDLASRVGAGAAADEVPRRSGELPPLAEDVQLTAALEKALRDGGVDTASMTVSEFTHALLAHAGYSLLEGASAGTYVASRGGGKTYIGFVDHVTGSYPELSEQAVNTFLAGFYSSGAASGLLFSDKYGPFLVYEKERRDDRVRFITRERLQHFVDSIATL